jgi:hypothetical protein
VFTAGFAVLLAHSYLLLQAMGYCSTGFVAHQMRDSSRSRSLRLLLIDVPWNDSNLAT